MWRGRGRGSCQAWLRRGGWAPSSDRTRHCGHQQQCVREAGTGPGTEECGEQRTREHDQHCDHCSGDLDQCSLEPRS